MALEATEVAEDTPDMNEFFIIENLLTFSLVLIINNQNSKSTPQSI